MITSNALELLHMDLIGTIQVESLGGKRYVFVAVDDFSRFTWLNYIKEKSDTFDIFEDLCQRLLREKDNVFRNDDGKKFENANFFEFCAAEVIAHEFSSPITPHQNGVVERNNKSFQETTKVMLYVKHLPYHFWNEAMNTACCIHNCVTRRSGTSITLCELCKGRKPFVKYFHVFGSKCYTLDDGKQNRKIDPESNEGIFLGYSTNSRAYKVFNSRTKIMMESTNTVIGERVFDVEEDVRTSS